MVRYELEVALIPVAYQVEGPPRVEAFEPIFPLWDIPELGGRGAG